MEIEKIKTYVGFAIKSRNIVYGVDEITKKPKSEIILYSSSLTKSGQEKLSFFADKNKIFIKVLEQEEFYEIIHSENIKAIAVLDKNLADAIKKNLTI